MSDNSAVPVIVVSLREDDAEAVSSALRNAGLAAHCSWIRSVADLEANVRAVRPELMVVFPADALNPEAVVAVRDEVHSEVPVVVVAAEFHEQAVSAAMQAGAQDLVTLDGPEHLQAVAQREVLACRTTRALDEALASAGAFQEQIEAMVNEATDAMVYTSEGIIVSLNPAWLELFGYAEADDLIGTPVMDIFSDGSRSAVKGALVACAEGKWTGHTLRTKVLGSDGTPLTVEADLETALLDDEPCVRISMSPAADRSRELEEQIVQLSERHPLTGFLQRQRFLERMGEQLADSQRAGVRALAYIKPDNFANIRDQVGPIVSDDILLRFARMLEDTVKANDLYGQFGGDMFMVLLSRGTVRDCDAWAENLRSSVAAHVFEVADKSLSITTSIGLAVVEAGNEDIEGVVLKAQKAHIVARDKGGDRIYRKQARKAGQDPEESDEVLVKRIKKALMTDAFRLVYQPVASLQGKSLPMFDVLLRMLDDGGREIMPGKFLPAAQRNGLMKNIDRWVIANAIAFATTQPGAQLFIRLSDESIPDRTLAAWIQRQMQAARVDANRLVFQVTEINAEEHLRETKMLADELTQAGCRLAIEHFGVGNRPLQVLEHVSPIDYIKVDGSLMEGLVGSKQLQAQVRAYIESAKSKTIATIAERVEDANTMAVLWQLGVEFIQGYYVQGPEEVVLETAGTAV